MGMNCCREELIGSSIVCIECSCIIGSVDINYTAGANASVRSSSGCQVFITFCCIYSNCGTKCNTIGIGCSNLYSAVIDNNAVACLQSRSSSTVQDCNVRAIAEDDLTVGSINDGVLTLVAIPVSAGSNTQLTAVNDDITVVGQHVHVRLDGLAAPNCHIGILQHDIAVGTNSSIGGSAAVPLINVHQQSAFALEDQIAGDVGVDSYAAAGIVCQLCAAQSFDHYRIVIIGGCANSDSIVATVNICALFQGNGSLTVYGEGNHNIVLFFCTDGNYALNCIEVVNFAFSDLYDLSAEYDVSFISDLCATVVAQQILIIILMVATCRSLVCNVAMATCAGVGGVTACGTGRSSNNCIVAMGMRYYIEELVAVSVCCVIVNNAIGDLDIHAIHSTGCAANVCSYCAVITIYVRQFNCGTSSENSTAISNSSNHYGAVLDDNICTEGRCNSLVDNCYVSAVDGDNTIGSVDHSKLAVIVSIIVATSNDAQLTARDGDVTFLRPDNSIGLLDAILTLQSYNSIIQNDVAYGADNSDGIATVPHPSSSQQTSAILTGNGEGAVDIREDSAISATAGANAGIILYDDIHIVAFANVNCVAGIVNDNRAIQFDGGYTANREVNLYLPIGLSTNRYCAFIIGLEVVNFAAFGGSYCIARDCNRCGSASNGCTTVITNEIAIGVVVRNNCGGIAHVAIATDRASVSGVTFCGAAGSSYNTTITMVQSCGLVCSVAVATACAGVGGVTTSSTAGSGYNCFVAMLVGCRSYGEILISSRIFCIECSCIIGNVNLNTSSSITAYTGSSYRCQCFIVRCEGQGNGRSESNTVFMHCTNIYGAVANGDTISSLQRRSCSLVLDDYLCAIAEDDLAGRRINDGILTLVAIPVGSGRDLQQAAINDDIAVVGQHVHISFATGSTTVNRHIGVFQYDIAVGTNSSVGGSAAVPLINVQQQLSFALEDQVAGDVGVDRNTAARSVGHGCITQGFDHCRVIVAGNAYRNRISVSANVCAIFQGNCNLTAFGEGNHYIIVSLCCSRYYATNGIEVNSCAAFSNFHRLCANANGGLGGSLDRNSEELIAVSLCCIVCSCIIGRIDVHAAFNAAGCAGSRCSCCAVITLCIGQVDHRTSSENSSAVNDSSNLNGAVLDGDVCAKGRRNSLIDNCYVCAVFNGDLTIRSIDQAKLTVIICISIGSGNDIQLTAGNGNVTFLRPDVSVGLVAGAFTLQSNNSIVQDDVTNGADHSVQIAAVPHPAGSIQLSAVLTGNGEVAGDLREDGNYITICGIQMGIILYDNVHIFAGADLNSVIAALINSRAI